MNERERTNVIRAALHDIADTARGGNDIFRARIRQLVEDIEREIIMQDRGLPPNVGAEAAIARDQAIARLCNLAESLLRRLEPVIDQALRDAVNAPKD